MLALGGFTLSGSSPLARGSPHGPPHRQPGRGIIPARAGFTLVSACRSGVSGDHPRSRGVHGGGWGDGVAGLGSSPLARGSLLHREVGRSVDRIIPARAGFTSPTPAAAPSPSDHPRSRGVHPSASSGRATGFGSSPLARGSRHRPVRPHPQPRIIPARAGFTPGGGREHAADRDHPRSRGVHRSASVGTPWGFGSSPLARGSRRAHQGNRVYKGIIPARAGFTLADPWNPNDESPYQTSFAFTADLALAPQSSDNAAVAQRSTRTPSEA